MQYPLTEKIGDPELLVGREKEFRQFEKWLANIPKRLRFMEKLSFVPFPIRQRQCH